MNECHFIGRLTRDPELRTTNNDKQVVNFGLAVNTRRGKGQDDEVAFLEMEAWDTGAVCIAEHFKKGDGIVVTSASVKQDNWKDKDSGQNRSKLKFRVNKFEFPISNGNGNGGGKSAEKKATNKSPDTGDVGADDGNNIPF